MEYNIEKNIPLIKSSRKSKYPYKQMKVGDSVVLGDYSTQNMTKFSNAARSWTRVRENGWKFSFRKTSDNKIRCWRTK